MCVTTFIPPLLPRRVVELEVDLAVLSSLGPVLAVLSSLVGLVVDLGAECVGELFGGTAALLAQVVTLAEVLAQVPVVAVGRHKSKHKASTQNFFECITKKLERKKNTTFSTPIVFLRSVSITKVAEVVVPAQVF